MKLSKIINNEDNILAYNKNVIKQFQISIKENKLIIIFYNTHTVMIKYWGSQFIPGTGSRLSKSASIDLLFKCKLLYLPLLQTESYDYTISSFMNISDYKLKFFEILFSSMKICLSMPS